MAAIEVRTLIGGGIFVAAAATSVDRAVDFEPVAESSLIVSAPAEAAADDGVILVKVRAARVEAIDVVRVFIDGDDVTEKVAVEGCDLSAVELDEGPLYETIDQSLRVLLPDELRTWDSLVRVECEARGPKGVTSSAGRDTRLVPRLRVLPVTGTPVFLDDETVGVDLWLHDLPVGDVVPTLAINGLDVSTDGFMKETTRSEAFTDGDRSRWSRTRVSFDVALLELGAVAGDVIDVGAVVRDATGASLGTVASTYFVEPSARLLSTEDCVKECVCVFLTAIGATKDASGNVSVDCDETTKDPESVGSAVQALRDCLALCQPQQNSIGGQTITCPSGLKVKIALGNGGSSSGDVTASGPASGAGAVDVVVAIGGNGGTGSQRGGNATATNARAGGAAVAIGGNGGSGGSGGAGGTATATGGSGGDASARGGNGGQQANGGDGSATTTDSQSTPTADPCGNGGDGGDPSNNGNAGGNGGAGAGSFNGTSASGAGGNSCGAGKHGTGGNTRRSGTSVTGTAGSCVNNS